MPFFNIMLNGEGILIPTERPEHAIVGFYTTRIVRAANAQEAGRAACAMVQRQWLSPAFTSNNTGGEPRLAIESIQRTTFWAWLRSRNTGHSFYGADDATEKSRNHHD